LKKHTPKIFFGSVFFLLNDRNILWLPVKRSLDQEVTCTNRFRMKLDKDKRLSTPVEMVKQVDIQS